MNLRVMIDSSFYRKTLSQLLSKNTEIVRINTRIAFSIMLKLLAYENYMTNIQF